jgi:feruloyl esterase
VPDTETGAVGQNDLGPFKSPSTGQEIFGTYQPGTELAWGLLIGGPDPYETALDQFRYMVFDDPKWDWRTFDVDRDLAKADQKLNGLLTAIDPKSLGKFFARGGKLLTYQGWSDQDISPLASVNFYKNVQSTMGAAQASRSMTLFMVPRDGPLRRRRRAEHLRHDAGARAVGREGAGSHAR